MNRAKIWGFTLLVLAAGAINIYVVTQRATDDALEQVGSSVRAGTAQVEAGARLFARQVADVAALAARDPELVSALQASAEAPAPPKGPGRRAPPPPPADVASLAEKALRSAAKELEVDVSRSPLLAIASEQAVSFRVGDRLLSGKETVVQAVLGNSGGRHLRVDDVPYYVVGVDVGRAGRLAFGLPLDPRWPERLKAATGADLTIAAGSKLLSTLPAPEAAAVVAAAKRGSGSAVDGGRLAPVRLPGGLPLPAVPLLFAKAPAFRARAIALPGADGPSAVVSAPARALLEPVAVYQQLSLAALAALFVVGLVLGLLPERTITAHVPRELASAADRIARGDFDARVPRMSGTFGTVASALNRAADAARMARVAPSATLPPTGIAIPPSTPANTLDVPLLAVPPPELPAAGMFDDPFAHGIPSSPAPAAAPTPLNGTTPSQPTPLPFPLPQRTGTARFDAAEPLAPQIPAVAPPFPPPPVPAESDESAWQGVFQEFLRVREECGEPVEGLTWERFRQKLQKNRDSLVQKYACRTVRFQVYVKEGKAALKATPVR
ncbi:MAG TPA: MXAN_5187 family protein [Anaeromyxobacteraceae bacterium]|nr:MXAN_5187 family protein [Anaeromyxobacteraceae bacterium]